MLLPYHYYLTKRRADMMATPRASVPNSRTFPDARPETGDFYVRIHELDAALEHTNKARSRTLASGVSFGRRSPKCWPPRANGIRQRNIVASLLKDDPKDPEAIALRATLLLETRDPGQIKAVTAELQPRVLKLPGDATLHCNLGRAYMAGDPPNRDQACQEFQLALQIDSFHVPAKLALVAF